MKPWYTKAYIMLPIALILIFSPFALPIIKHEIHFLEGDILSFYGSILGAAATIFAFITTIKFTLKNQKIERKLSVKPQLQSDYSPIFDRKNAASEASNNALFVQYPFNSNNVGSSYDVPYSIESDINRDVSGKIIHNLSFERQYYILKYLLTNVGAGNAVDIRLSIDTKSFMPPFAISVGSYKTFVFVFGSELITNKSHKVVLNFRFRDVASIAEYEQQEIIELYTEDDGSLNIKQDANAGILSDPREIG